MRVYQYETTTIGEKGHWQDDNSGVIQSPILSRSLLLLLVVLVVVFH